MLTQADLDEIGRQLAVLVLDAKRPAVQQFWRDVLLDVQQKAESTVIDLTQEGNLICQH